MCYKDWVNSFSSFDVCLLPTEFSEKKNGPIFKHQNVVQGKFKSDEPTVQVRMKVSQKTNIYIQTLLDVCIGEAKSDQFLIFNVKGIFSICQGYMHP